MTGQTRAQAESQAHAHAYAQAQAGAQTQEQTPAQAPEAAQPPFRGRMVRRRFFGHAGAMTGLLVLTLVIVLAFSASGIRLWGVVNIPGWWHYSYDEVLPIINGTAPTYRFPLDFGDHPFGQDRVGRDMFAMTMRGAQLSIIVMFTIGIIGTVIGVLIGAAAGYFRGTTGAVLMRITDLVIIVPGVVIAAVLGVLVGHAGTGRTVLDADGNVTVVYSFSDRVFTFLQQNLGVVLLGIFLGLVIWTSMARLVRAEFLVLRELEFVDAARLAGASDLRIILKHLLPNAVGVIIVNATLLMSSAILLEAGLSYLGFGVQAPDTSLGLLVVANQSAMSTRPWLFWWPGVFIVVICLCINFIGDGLRDAFDPRRGRIGSAKTPAVRDGR